MFATKRLQSIMFIVTCIPTLQVYTQPADLVVRDTIITAEAIFAASNSITAGPNFTIASTGDVTFRTSGSIYFRSDVIITQGGMLRTVGGQTVDVRALEAPLPMKFALMQNYPNPFNPSTNIRFAVKEQVHVSLIVFDVLGQSVETLVDEELPAGEYEARFVPSTLPSGIYVYRITINSFIESRRMLLLK